MNPCFFVAVASAFTVAQLAFLGSAWAVGRLTRHAAAAEILRFGSTCLGSVAFLWWSAAIIWAFVPWSCS